MAQPIDPADDGARTDYAGSMSYGDYLRLDAILGAQQPRSPDPNELLFIVQHQTSELWMKLALHELTAARALVHAWNVLATMTPSEYSAIRPYLGASSGFQSWQYRAIEYILGNKNAAMLKPHAHRADIQQSLAQALAAPSLYDEALALLARRGLAIAPAVLARDVREPWTFDESVEHAWLAVYRAPREHWELYELAEELVDLEDAFRQWRFRHVTTVERIIGFKRGTGGTSGVSYLRRMLDVVLFPELWKARTDL